MLVIVTEWQGVACAIGSHGSIYTGEYTTECCIRVKALTTTVQVSVYTYLKALHQWVLTQCMEDQLHNFVFPRYNQYHKHAAM